MFLVFYKKNVKEGGTLLKIVQSDIGKRIEVRYTPSDKRVKGTIENVTNRAISIRTDRKSMVYIPFTILERYDVRIH